MPVRIKIAVAALHAADTRELFASSLAILPGFYRALPTAAARLVPATALASSQAAENVASP
jgi:hypothetical protein